MIQIGMCKNSIQRSAQLSILKVYIYTCIYILYARSQQKSHADLIFDSKTKVQR
jgi:hypothetical protein